MHAPDDGTPASRSGVRRLIGPREYRHVHAAMAVRFAAGGFQLGVGLFLVGLGGKAGTDAERRKMYWLAAGFLAPAAFNFVGGLLDLTAARAAPPRT
jgi:hypothetical protein